MEVEMYSVWSSRIYSKIMWSIVANRRFSLKQAGRNIVVKMTWGNFSYKEVLSMSNPRPNGI